MIFFCILEHWTQNLGGMSESEMYTVKCKLCSFKTSTKELLSYHQRHMHVKNKIYKCKLCHFTCKLTSNMEKHFNSVHLNMVDCHKCNKSFKSNR